MKSLVSHSILLSSPIVTPSTCTRQTVAKFQPCYVLDISFHCFACALSTSSPPDSSPNYTSWPCSRAPSPLHIATRASKVGGQMGKRKGRYLRFSSASSRHRAHWGSLDVVLSWDGCLCTDRLPRANHSKWCESHLCFDIYSNSTHHLVDWDCGGVFDCCEGKKIPPKNGKMFPTQFEQRQESTVCFHTGRVASSECLVWLQAGTFTQCLSQKYPLRGLRQ